MSVRRFLPVILTFIFALIFIVLAFFLIRLNRTISPDSSLNQDSILTPTPLVEIKDYSRDSDSDSLPDFIETRLSLDPQKNDIEACYHNSCNDPAFEQAYVKKHNIVIVLDSSGSMSLKLGSDTKMEAAKQAIISFISKLDNQAQVGLVQYGHLGSNSTADRDISCSGTQVLSPIGNLNSSNITSLLSPVQPTGWTPIGLALQKTQELFVGKEKDTNEVFVVTDGAETCNTNPVAAAAALVASPARIKVNIIGFAVTDEEKTSLEAINTAGQGSYSSASSSSDIEDIFARNLKNWSTLTNAHECIDKTITNLTTCVVDLHNRIDNFRQSYISNPQISRDESEANEQVYYSFITELQNFENQKYTELNRTRSGYINGL